MASTIRNQEQIAEPVMYRKQHLIPGTEIVTSLPLQVALYFNVLYSCPWFVGCVVALGSKYAALAYHYQFIFVIIYVIMFAVEILRLYLGYEGNLREKVPELAGFWLLTLLQTPLVLFVMANTNTIILPLDAAINVPLLAFLLAQLCLGFRALQLMIGAQAVKFYLSQFAPQDGVEMRSR